VLQQQQNQPRIVSTATESTATTVVSAATVSSAAASDFLQDTTVKTATTAKLKNTFSS
jgi:hypothetical protein